MSDAIIRVENLGKKYIINHQQKESYSALRDVIARQAKLTGRKLLSPFSKNPAAPSKEEFWALKDVSFEVKRGEAIGIIGRNGAGKSTLLKILSHITEPTTGRIILRGRVASLLEVGTGFHPELTGRENIYLNGAVLGMGRAEIKRKFDEIVDFAEVEKFLDTPVKRYSSGMYVRLAFAVAAHLEPEILIVDEVLAVGDAQFQKKCLGKMDAVAKREGRTVILVSHQMASVSNLCSSSVVLEGGKLIYTGNTETAIEHYLQQNKGSNSKANQTLDSFRPSWSRSLIKSVRLLNSTGEEQSSFSMGSSITVEMTFEAEEGDQIKSPVMGVVINRVMSGVVGGVNTRMSGFWLEDGPYSTATLRCKLKQLPLLQGEYTIDIWLGDGVTDVDCIAGYLSFRVEEADFYKSGHPPFSHLGSIFLEPEWQVIGNYADIV